MAHITDHTGIEAAVANEEQRQHWSLLDEKLEREWSALDPAAGLSGDVLTYATENIGVLETGIKVRLLLSLLRVSDGDLTALWQPMVKFLSASQQDSEPWVRSAMDIVVTRLVERNIHESIVNTSQLPLPTGTIECAKDEVLSKMRESWRSAWDARKPVRIDEPKEEQIPTTAVAVAKGGVKAEATPGTTSVKTELTPTSAVNVKKENATNVTASIDVTMEHSKDAKPTDPTQNGQVKSEPKTNGIHAAVGVKSESSAPSTEMVVVKEEDKVNRTSATGPATSVTQLPVKKEGAQESATTSTVPATATAAPQLLASGLAAPSSSAVAALKRNTVPSDCAEDMYVVPPDFCPAEWLFASQNQLLQQGHYDLAHSARNVHFTPLAMEKFTVAPPGAAGAAPNANGASAARASRANGNGNSVGVNGGRMSRMANSHHLTQQQLAKHTPPMRSAAEIMARRARKPTTTATNKPISKIVDHNEMEQLRLQRQAMRGSGRGSARGGRGGTSSGSNGVKRRSGVMMTRGGSASAMRGGSSKRGRGGIMHSRGGMMQRHMSTSSSLASPGSDSGSEYHHHHQTHDPDRTPYASSEGSYPRPSPSPSPPHGSPVMASPGWSPGAESPSESPQPMSPNGGGGGGALIAANLLRDANKISVENRRVVEAFSAGEGNPTPDAGDERRILHSMKLTKTANPDLFMREIFYIIINYETRKYRKIKQKKYVKRKAGGQPTPSPSPPAPSPSPPASL